MVILEMINIIADQECFITEEFESQCVDPVDRKSIPKILYPGYECKIGDPSLGVCAFGKRYCGAGNQCVGFPLYSQCKRSADCFFGAFCNFGRCVPTLELNSLCNSHEACGRGALCLYNDALSAFGVCTELMSVDADTLIMGKTKAGVYSKLFC